MKLVAGRSLKKKEITTSSSWYVWSISDVGLVHSSMSRLVVVDTTILDSNHLGYLVNGCYRTTTAVWNFMWHISWCTKARQESARSAQRHYGSIPLIGAHQDGKVRMCLCLTLPIGGHITKQKLGEYWLLWMTVTSDERNSYLKSTVKQIKPSIFLVRARPRTCKQTVTRSCY
jgi:hypothetical protein